MPVPESQTETGNNGNNCPIQKLLASHLLCFMLGSHVCYLRGGGSCWQWLAMELAQLVSGPTDHAIREKKAIGRLQYTVAF